MSLFNKSKSSSETINNVSTENNLSDSRRGVSDEGVLIEQGGTANIDKSSQSTVLIEQVSDDIAITAINRSTGLADSFLDDSLSFLKDASMKAENEAVRGNELATKFFNETARINKQQAFGLEGEILGNVKTVAIVGILAIGAFFVFRKSK